LHCLLIPFLLKIINTENLCNCACSIQLDKCMVYSTQSYRIGVQYFHNKGVNSIQSLIWLSTACKMINCDDVVDIGGKSKSDIIICSLKCIYY